MRWIEVDTDFTDDDRIASILTTYGRRRNWAIGVLVQIWAYVGKAGGGPLEPGGAPVIGASVDSSGRPFTINGIAAKVKAKPIEIVQLLDRSASEGHIDSKLWSDRKIVFFPAMQKRADGYTKKKLAKQKRNQHHSGGGNNGSGGGVSGQSPDSVGTVSGETPESVRQGLCTVRYGVPSSTYKVQERDRDAENAAPVDRYEGPDRRRPIEPPTPRAKQGDGALAGGFPRDHLKCHRQPCGRICIPGRVHTDFLRQLGGDRDTAETWLDGFYTRTLATIPDGVGFGDRPLDFWRDHFAAAVPNIAPKGRKNGGPDPAAARTSAPDNKYDHLTRRDTDDDDQLDNGGNKPN